MHNLMQPDIKHWNDAPVNPRPKLEPWSRLMMDNFTLVQFYSKQLSRSCYAFFRILAKKLPPPRDEPNDPFLIERFIFQTLEEVESYRGWILFKGFTVKETAQKLWEDRQWAKAVVIELRPRAKITEFTFKDILGRAAIKCYLGNHWNHSQIIGYCYEYASRHPGVAHGKFDNIDVTQIQEIEADIKNAYNTPTTIQDIATFNALTFSKRKPGFCVACPAHVLCCLLGATKSGLSESDFHIYEQEDISGGKINTFENLFPTPMISIEELKQCINLNKNKGIENHIFNALLQEYETTVCTRVAFFFFFFLYFIFCIVVSFLFDFWQ